MRKFVDLNREEILPLIEDAYRNITSHSGMWFRNADEEFGMEEAIRLDGVAWQAIAESRIARLLETQGLKEGQSISSLFTNWNKELLTVLLTDLAKNWLAADGAWFQAVEKSHGMTLAKKLNDKAWEKFTVIEAKRIMQRLHIPPGTGLAALEEALDFRLYARINRQETLYHGENNLVFRMNECRVQAARERRKLPDYPCKSAGVIEYTNFAKAIDPRIVTRCIACPPDPHPKEYHCAWEFQLK